MSHGRQRLTLNTSHDLRDFLANAVRSCTKGLVPSQTEQDVNAISRWLDIYWDDLKSIDDEVVQAILRSDSTDQSMQALAEKHK